jgi:methyltransferase (TIGR00027 family)
LAASPRWAGPWRGEIAIASLRSYALAVEGVAATSLMTAAARERESARPDRLFDDPWAGLLAGDTGRAFLDRQDKVQPANHAIFVIRHRFFDDFLLDSVGRGIRQVVLVAAGLDTRSFRLRWPEGTVVYELDQPQVLAYKQAVLDKAGATPSCERVAVPVDLREDWPAELLASDFLPARATVWLAEGLLFYLPEVAVRSLLSTIASVSAPGSVIGTDMMSATMLASESRRAWVQLYADAGAPFVFGTDTPAEVVTSCGWSPSIHLVRDIGEHLSRPLLTPAEPGPPSGAILTATLS